MEKSDPRRRRQTVTYKVSHSHSSVGRDVQTLFLGKYGVV